MSIVANIDAMEFGWMLMRWQGHLRWLSRNNDIEVHCLDGNSYIYRDFASRIYVHAARADIDYLDKWDSNIKGPYDEIKYVAPSKKICEARNLKQEFVKYGRKRYGGKYSYDILFHARNCKRKGDEYTGDRRYRHWREVADAFSGLNTAWIGTEADCYGEDLRGLPLDVLADVMASSKLIVGPSSGIMHFASLCGLKHLVWTDKRKWNIGNKKATNWNRYKKHWNPFNTPCEVLDTQGWQPPPEYVIERVNRAMA